MQLQQSTWTKTYGNQYTSTEACGNGDTISPKIFTAAIEEEVFKKLNLEKNGVNVDGE